MTEVKSGDTIRVNYKGTLEDGTLIDANEAGKPYEFQVGAGRVIPGVEKSVVGMSPGDVKTVEVVPEDGYGPYRQDLIVEMEKSLLGDDIDLQPGTPVEVRRANEMSVIGHLKEVRGSTVLIDANHPLAGKKLRYDIELVEIMAPQT